MRTQVLAWSAASGVILGVFADVALVAIWLVIRAFGQSRTVPRIVIGAGVMLLVAVPLVAGVLGYLEGRLKLS